MFGSLQELFSHKHEIVLRHAGVRIKDHLHQQLNIAASMGIKPEKVSQVARCRCLKMWLIQKRRVCLSQLFQPVYDKENLNIDRLLHPHGSIVVQNGNSLGFWHKISALRICGGVYITDDCFLSWCFVP
ncbi:hypothetical protein [Methanosarcina thermophila]